MYIHLRPCLVTLGNGRRSTFIILRSLVFLVGVFSVFGMGTFLRVMQWRPKWTRKLIYIHMWPQISSCRRPFSVTCSSAPKLTQPDESFEGDVALLRKGPTQRPTNVPGAAFTSSPLPRQDTPRLSHYRVGWLRGAAIHP